MGMQGGTAAVAASLTAGIGIFLFFLIWLPALTIFVAGAAFYLMSGSDDDDDGEDMTFIPLEESELSPEMHKVVYEKFYNNM